MRLMPCGDRAVLLEPDEPGTVLALAAAARELPAVREVVPALRTLLVVAADPAALSGLEGALRELDPAASDAAVEAEEIVLDVDYDGPDLAGTADELRLDPDELVRAHAAGSYVVAFCGFAPGFAYLTGLSEQLHAPRLAEPRTRVPAGAVGIAGEFTGVYPRPSPGGWRLLGRTDAALWDLHRDPPALLTPGTRVRFCPT